MRDYLNEPMEYLIFKIILGIGIGLFVGAILWY